MLDETNLRREEDKAADAKQKAALVEILKRDRELRDSEAFVVGEGGRLVFP